MAPESGRPSDAIEEKIKKKANLAGPLHEGLDLSVCNSFLFALGSFFRRGDILIVCVL